MNQYQFDTMLASPDTLQQRFEIPDMVNEILTCFQNMNRKMKERQSEEQKNDREGPSIFYELEDFQEHLKTFYTYPQK